MDGNGVREKTGNQEVYWKLRLNEVPGGGEWYWKLVRWEKEGKGDRSDKEPIFWRRIETGWAKRVGREAVESVGIEIDENPREEEWNWEPVRVGNVGSG